MERRQLLSDNQLATFVTEQQSNNTKINTNSNIRSIMNYAELKLYIFDVLETLRPDILNDVFERYTWPCNH